MEKTLETPNVRNWNIEHEKERRVKEENYPNKRSF